MIANHHPGPGRKALVRDAGRIREDDAFDSAGGQDPDSGGYVSRLVSLIQMDTALRENRPGAPNSSEDETSDVSRDRGLGQLGELRVRDVVFRRGIGNENV